MCRRQEKAGRVRSAIGRSFDIYYRDQARTARMDALNAEFVGPGDLAFDIGAHVGDRTGSFLRLGAQVVAVEPQPRVYRALRLIYGRSDRVRIQQSAVGALPGTLPFHVNTENPTVSTASPQFVAAAGGAPEWEGQVWDRKISVPVTTLDALIKAHGRPGFVKIDVEGHELDVLKGLSEPLRALSFEFTTIQRELAYACLDRLDALGAYQFNFSLGEDHRLVQSCWVDRARMQADISALNESANSGDIFARLAI